MSEEERLCNAIKEGVCNSHRAFASSNRITPLYQLKLTNKMIEKCGYKEFECTDGKNDEENARRQAPFHEDIYYYPTSTPEKWHDCTPEEWRRRHWIAEVNTIRLAFVEYGRKRFDPLDIKDRCTKFLATTFTLPSLRTIYDKRPSELRAYRNKVLEEFFEVAPVVFQEEEDIIRFGLEFYVRVIEKLLAITGFAWE